VPDISVRDIFEISVGAIFVMTSASARFNTPPTIRSYTTALRYYTAWLCYLLIGMALYSGLAVFSSPVIQALRGGNGGHKGDGMTGSLTLAAAVLLALLMPHMPILPTADAWARKRLQQMAAIPFEARQLAAVLRKATFTVSPDLQAEVASRMAGEGLHSAAWTKISALMIQLETWEGDRRFGAFVTKNPLAFRDLKQRFVELEPKIRLVHDIGPRETDAVGDRFAALVQHEAAEQSAELLNRIYDFISRGLLQACATYGARVGELKRLGFDSSDVEPSPKPLTLNQLITLFLAIEVAMMAGIVIFMHPEATVYYGHYLILGTMASAMYTVAVLCALYLKRLGFARRGRDGRPTAFYVTAGLLAAAASAVIRLAFLLSSFHPIGEAWNRFRLYSPISLCAFLAAFMVAWMMDDETTSGLSRNRLRWLEGVTGALALLAGNVVALQWMKALAGNPQLGLGELYRAQPANPAVMFGLSAVVGFGIGFLIPTWYRDAAQEGRRSAELSSAEPPAAMAA
jgi:hypothetical protein